MKCRLIDDCKVMKNPILVVGCFQATEDLLHITL